MPLEYSNAPARIPARSDVYTSFVKSARPIAITGGSNEKMVAYATLVYSPLVSFPPVIIVTTSNAANTASSTSITICFLLIFTYSPPSLDFFYKFVFIITACKCVVKFFLKIPYQLVLQYVHSYQQQNTALHPLQKHLLSLQELELSLHLAA